jgi:fatty-acyl-CoA synthase
MTLSDRFEGATVASALTTRATTDPEGIYLRFGDDQLTFGDIESKAESLAASLSNLGLQAGDRLALVLPPCAEFVVTMFASAKLGVVIVPLNPELPSSDLQYALRHSEAVCAVTIEEAFGTDYLAIFEELMDQLPELRHLVTVGHEDLWYGEGVSQFEDLVSAGAGRDYIADTVDPRESCFALVYTSGTMGKPKGVELSHSNLLAAAAGTADAIGLGEEDIVVGVSALFHVFGLGPGLLSTLLAGASVVLHQNTGAEAMLESTERHLATVHYGIPTHFVAELDALAERTRDLSSLRLVVIAGAPVSDELVERLASELGVIVTTAYSVTETSSTVCASSPADPQDKRRFTAGRPIAGTSVRVLEADGSELPVESVGEVAVSGPGVMLGYHRQPKETSGAFDPDGYFLTGDLGLLDEEGYLHLVGRKKDVIIKAGFNVYPREVETRIESHPAVQEVAVVGIPDPLLGEAICACIVPVEGAIVTGQDIVDWCRETLADPKVPDVAHFLDELPRTDTGQVRRTDLSRQIRSKGQSV